MEEGRSSLVQQPVGDEPLALDFLESPEDRELLAIKPPPVKDSNGERRVSTRRKSGGVRATSMPTGGRKRAFGKEYENENGGDSGDQQRKRPRCSL